VPRPPATTDAGYLLASDEIVAPIVRGFRPELIMRGRTRRSWIRPVGCWSPRQASGRLVRL